MNGRSIVWTTGASCAVATVASVGMIGSDAWLAAGYRSAAVPTSGAERGVVGDETFWLAQRTRDVTLASAAGHDDKLRGLIPVTPNGGEFEITRVTPMPPMVGEPNLLLVSARDPNAPDRVHRFVIEADAVTGGPLAKSL